MPKHRITLLGQLVFERSVEARNWRSGKFTGMVADVEDRLQAPCNRRRHPCFGNSAAVTYAKFYYWTYWARERHVASLMLSNSTKASRVQPDRSILSRIASKETRQSVCCRRP